jgi:type II secretory ATPase GspE/PulE/Tfp pilus assembly ATPase PilB-like protein
MKLTLDLKTLTIPSEILSEIPARIAVHYGVMPLGVEKSVLQVGIPTDMTRASREELKILLGREVELIPASRTELNELISQFYGMGAGVIESLTQDQSLEEGKSDSEIIDQDKKEDATMTRLVNELFMDAIRCRASDIHIEPFERALRIRYRVDGLLQQARVSDQIRMLAAHLISRIKIMAKLDIGEKRLPQDGRIKIKQKNEELDLRISVLPSSYGEAVVIRILKPLQLLEMTDLGFEDMGLEKIRKLIKKPNGIILITGPTGSGKTTTLYSLLRELNQIERKIITVEDPVEYKLPGIVQMQTHSKIDFTFAKALRSILRHDPDCIMIGEIRDSETAEIAIRASLTGHLVLSTLHTNDAPSAVTRLIEMGIQPYLVASSVEAVMAQRLVRRVCPDCSPSPSQECRKCLGSGFYGRIAIYELMVMDAAIRERLAEKASSDVIREIALKSGMKSLWGDGIQKVKLGLTAKDEIERVVYM